MIWGLYSLILKSQLPKAKKFKNWVTRDVLPSIRKYGKYVQKKESENEMLKLADKINYLVKENIRLKSMLKTDKFPQGGLVYAVDYSTEDTEAYRIGMTGEMAKRKKIHDTHTLYKRKVPHFKPHDCPLQYETCIRTLLYPYRTQDNKDTYECSLAQIKKIFRICAKSISCANKDVGVCKSTKTGGNNTFSIDKIIKEETKKYDSLRKKILNLNKELKKMIV
jgi:hypothetical protein